MEIGTFRRQDQKRCWTCTLRGDFPDQAWAPVVWFTRSIPRHSFHSWLMILNRCPTKDRMLRWGFQVDPNCLLCNSRLESRDNLYYDCSYSFDLWTMIATRCRITPRRTWDETINQMQALAPQKANRLLTLLSWQASLYWIWNERLSRLHTNTFRSADVLFTIIDRQIRNKTQSFRESNPSLSSAMYQRWIDTTTSLSLIFNVLLVAKKKKKQWDQPIHHGRRSNALS